MPIVCGWVSWTKRIASRRRFEGVARLLHGAHSDRSKPSVSPAHGAGVRARSEASQAENAGSISVIRSQETPGQRLFPPCSLRIPCLARAETACENRVIWPFQRALVSRTPWSGRCRGWDQAAFSGRKADVPAGHVSTAGLVVRTAIVGRVGVRKKCRYGWVGCRPVGRD